MLSIRSLEACSTALPVRAGSLHAWLLLLGEVMFRCLPRMVPDEELYRLSLDVSRRNTFEEMLPLIVQAVVMIAARYGAANDDHERDQLHALIRGYGENESIALLVQRVLAHSFPEKSFHSLRLISDLDQRGKRGG